MTNISIGDELVRMTIRNTLPDLGVRLDNQKTGEIVYHASMRRRQRTPRTPKSPITSRLRMSVLVGLGTMHLYPTLSFEQKRVRLFRRAIGLLG